MAGSYRYLLIGGVVVGIAGGTVAALVLGGKDDRAVSATRSASEPAPPVSGGDGPTEGGSPPEASEASIAVRNANRARSLFAMGKDRLYAADIAGSVELVRQAIALDPEPEYVFVLAISLWAGEQYVESVRTLEQVLAMNPDARLRQRVIKRIRELISECETRGLSCGFKRQTIETIEDETRNHSDRPSDAMTQ